MTGELIQCAFLCMGAYMCVSVVSILLGCFIAKIINEPDDAMLYAWLTSTAGLTFSLLHIIGML